MDVACYTKDTRNKHVIYVRSWYDTNNIRIKSQRKTVRELLLFKVNKYVTSWREQVI